MSSKLVNHPNLLTGKLRVGDVAADYGVYSTGLVKKFEVGTRYRLGDRVFHYGRTETAANVGLGAKNEGIHLRVTGGVKTVTTAEQDWIDILLEAATYAAGWFGKKNQMVGGMVVIHAAGSNQKFRMITGHEKGTSAVTIKVYLDGPLGSAVAATSLTDIAQNPYAQLHSDNNPYSSVMGVSVITHVIYAYGWFQSWGPCWVVPALPVADTVNWRTVVFNSDGSIKGFDDAVAEAGHQVAGFVIDMTWIGSGADNPPFIFLQISP